MQDQPIPGRPDRGSPETHDGLRPQEALALEWGDGASGRCWSRTACRVTGINARPYDLRHGFVSLLIYKANAVDDARRSLPPPFQDRSVLDKVIKLADDRGEGLAKRASEPT